MQLWLRLQEQYSRKLDIVTEHVRQELCRKRRCTAVLRWVLTATICGTITFFTLFGIDFNAQIIPKFDSGKLDPGSFSNPQCFAKVTDDLNGRNKHFGMIPSVPVMEDDTCYDFAGLIHPFQYNFDVAHSEQQKNSTNTFGLTTGTIFHTYWTTAYSKQLTENQLSTLRSFTATQQGYNHSLYFWVSKGDREALINGNGLWNSTQESHSPVIRMKVIEEELTTYDVLLQLIASTSAHDVESLMRILSLYHYGGVWFDLDTLFIRGLTPLLHQEWTTQSDCHEPSKFFTRQRHRIDNRFRGTLMHFHKHSSYLCEMLSVILSNQKYAEHTLSSSGSRAQNIPNFKEYLYQLVFYRVLKHKITPWAVLPWCFTNPSHCRKSNSLPSLFEQATLTEADRRRLRQSFAHSYSRKWYHSPGTLFIELITQHKSITGW